MSGMDESCLVKRLTWPRFGCFFWLSFRSPVSHVSPCFSSCVCQNIAPFFDKSIGIPETWRRNFPHSRSWQRSRGMAAWNVGPAWSSHQLATLCYAMLRWWKLIPDEFWFDPDVCLLLLALAGHVEDATKRRTFLRFDSTLEYSLKHCQAFRAKSQATTYIHISHIACSSMLFISFLWRPTDYKIFLDRRHAVK